MGHIKYASDVGAPVEVAFTYTDTPMFVPEWMVGIATFEPADDAGYGSGAVYAATLRLGLWHPTVECEITQYRPNAVIGYTLRRRRSGKAAPADSDPAHTPAEWCTMTLHFDPLGYGRTVLTSEIEYPQAHRLPGRLGAPSVQATLRWALRRTESQLRRAIEEFHGTDLVGRIA
ncbi:SRPBCC family protein [Nocardia sp. CA2R105]|uniref:SRPBCC family protein n=1 Tax=Nocardia coffeae TaxID=2873381 RepID=UPI001CA63755|nr:SRPBCC family protein [Nocardia coffeae]MBY8858883.1 SRPBCC family protein [Nocardia coffeae]